MVCRRKESGMFVWELHSLSGNCATKKTPRQYPNALSIFGIPPEKATYVCCLNDDEEKPLYQFRYRIAGKILKDNTPALVEDVRFCHETYPYGAPAFPESHFDIEFFAELPWVIDTTAE